MLNKQGDLLDLQNNQTDNGDSLDGQLFAPLADRMRPSSLDNYIGQSQLIGEGKPLRMPLQSGKPHSMIFWGASRSR